MIKKIILKFFGIVLIIIGAFGIILPIIPGIVLIILGLSFLGFDFMKEYRKYKKDLLERRHIHVT